jgi:hypothetical protein
VESELVGAGRSGFVGKLANLWGLEDSLGIVGFWMIGLMF